MTLLGLVCFGQAFKCSNKQANLRPNTLTCVQEIYKDKGPAPVFGFESEIQKLLEAADRKKGIKWQLSDDNLLRDAVGDFGKHKHLSEYYMVQILNICRAAKKICELDGKSSNAFVEMAIDAMQEYKELEHLPKPEKFWCHKVEAINTKVVEALQKNIFPDEGVETINKKLRLAENYVGLDDTHYNVTTKFKVGDKQFGLEAKKCFKLTPAQQSEFINRQSTGWYKLLDPFEQKLLDAHVDKFLDGLHYIPTQIRCIPGCRNAYQKRILAYDQRGQVAVLGSYYHSGTLASFVKDQAISDQIAQHNWEQVVAHAPNVEVMSLNNNVNLKLGKHDLSEKFIVEQTRRIVGDERFMYIPINLPGKGTTLIFKEQIKQLLQDTARFYNNKYPILSKPLTSETMLLLEEALDPKDRRYFNRLKTLKEAAEKADWRNTVINIGEYDNNYYAKIGVNYIACKAVLDQQNGQSKASILFNCKSGKDRTGFISYAADSAIIHMTHPTLVKEEEIDKAMAYAGHPQFLASVNGGMPGRFGMKPIPLHILTPLCSATGIGDTDLARQLFAKPALLTKVSC